jgi:hypothetical protein
MRNLILFLTSVCLFAQAPVLVQGPYVGSITRSSAVVSWTTNIGSTTKIKSGYSDGSWTHTDGAFVWGSDTSIRVHTWYISGLNAGSTVYYQVCGTSYAGQVGPVRIANGGAGYTHPPVLSFSGGGGAGATAIATVSGGSITKVTVISEGYSYTSIPAITITPDARDSITIPAVLTASYITIPTEGCSSTYTFITLDQAHAPADPLPPVPVDPPVVPNGNIHTVAADCNAPSGGLVNLWATVPRGDVIEIDPAITPYCTGLFSFPKREDGPPYILTRVKHADSIFPNYRRASPADKPQMARFIHNAPNINDSLPLSATTTACFAGQLVFPTGQANHWAVYRCRNTNPQAITAITSSGNVRLTVPGHGLSKFDSRGAAYAPYSKNMIGVVGVTGAGASAINGGWAFNVIDANTLEITDWLYGNPVTAIGAASGGTIYLNAYQLEPVTEGPLPPPSTCNFGDWYHERADLGSEDEFHRTFYCHETNSFIPYRIDVLTPDDNGLGYNTTLPVIDLATNSPNYLMFQGLSFEPMKLKTDASALQFQFSPANNAVGTTYNSFIVQSEQTHHIYWDNILGVCPDPDPADPNGVMVSCFQFGTTMNGNHWHVGGSYFAGFQIYAARTALYDGMAGVFFMYHTGPHEFINNYIAGSGILVYYPDDDASTSWATDLTFKRNTLETPDKYWMFSPHWLGKGMYWSQRHRFETKRLRRGWLDGNIFKGGWVWNNNASGICLCTRGGAYGAQIKAINGSTISTFQFNAANHGYQLDLAPGDLVALNNTNYTLPCPEIANQIYTVQSVSKDKLTITVSPSTGCNSTGNGYASAGAIVGINRDSNNDSDILISNNTWINNPQDIYSLGHDSYPGAGTSGIVSTIQRRIKVNNSLSIGTDGGRLGLGAYCQAARLIDCNPAFAPSGSHLTFLDGHEDLQFTHNSVVARTMGQHFAYAPTFGLASGLKMQDNIIASAPTEGGYGVWTAQGTYFGEDVLAHSFFGLTPAYQASGNVVIRAGGGASLSYPMPSGTHFWDTGSGAFPFFDASADFHVTSTSDYSSGGTARATDGLDQGVDLNALIAARGDVLNVRAFNITSSSATVGFLAPDSMGCRVDWSTDNFATYTSVADAGGSRVRSITLVGLPANSVIEYRVNCAAMQPSGTFSTPR